MLYYSIDQNCNTLWDTIPKLQALLTKDLPFLHLVEDIDAAFTRVNPADVSSELKLTVEQYYSNGNIDWGASLFYMPFLGRCAINPQCLVEYSGISIKAMAKSMNLSLDEFYAKFSISDNFQLTAPSYLDQSRDKHRLLGDISIDEVKHHVDKLLEIAKQDLLSVFIDNDAQSRINKWFLQEKINVQTAINDSKTLSELYQKWLKFYLPAKNVGNTLNFFADSNVKEKSFELLKKILANYEEFSHIYNSSLIETASELSPISNGDLPFFAVYYQNGHLVRSAVTVVADKIVAGPYAFDLDVTYNEFFKEILCLPGKALLLVNIVRDADFGGALALPHLGSLYTPTAVRLLEKLQKVGWFNSNIFPITRVKFNFLDQLEKTNTTLRLPKYLHILFPKEISSNEFAKIFRDKIALAKKLLSQLKENKTRNALIESWFPEITQQIKVLNEEKLQAAKDVSTRALCPALWSEIKKLEAQKLHLLVARIVDLLQIENLDYWNSRGALLPWSVAASGEDFYQHLIENAQIIIE